VKLLLEKLLLKTCFLIIFWLADCYYKLRTEISLNWSNKYLHEKKKSNLELLFVDNKWLSLFVVENMTFGRLSVNINRVTTVDAFLVFTWSWRIEDHFHRSFQICL
jgi:hypothetical protein